MLPPNNRPLNELAAEEGISEATLYNWRRQARTQGRLLPDADAGSESLSAADKFVAVVGPTAFSLSPGVQFLLSPNNAGCSGPVSQRRPQSHPQALSRTGRGLREPPG